MKNLICLSLSLLLFTACDRMSLDSSTSSIHIQMPVQGSSIYKDTEIISSQSTYGISRPIPTGFTTGSKPFNCYLVAIGGPEPEMSRNVCGKKNALNEIDLTTANYVGVWAGGVTYGQDLTLDVASGKDRAIYMIGFHATTAEACRDFKTQNFPLDSEISDPYMLGKLVGVELKPGETTNLTIPIAYDYNNREIQRFDGCKGPDFPERSGGGGGGNYGPALATKLIFEKQFFPFNAFAKPLSGEIVCQSLDARLVDSNNNFAILPANATFTLKTNKTSTSFVDQSVYNSWQDCTSGTNSQTTFTIYSGTDRSQVYFRTTSDSDPATLTFTATIATAISGFSIVDSSAMPVYSFNKKAVQIEGPHQIVPGVCYKYALNKSTMNLAPVTTDGASTAVVTMPSGVIMYNSTNCSTGTAASNFTFAANQSSILVSLRLDPSYTISTFALSTTMYVSGHC